VLWETLDSKGRTHVRTTRTESTCDCGEYRSEYGIENENGEKKNVSNDLEISLIKGDRINNAKYMM